MSATINQENGQRPIDMRQFVHQNAAKDFRDKIQLMYEEFLCMKITKAMTVAEKD